MIGRDIRPSLGITTAAGPASRASAGHQCLARGRPGVAGQAGAPGRRHPPVGQVRSGHSAAHSPSLLAWAADARTRTVPSCPPPHRYRGGSGDTIWPRGGGPRRAGDTIQVPRRNTRRAASASRSARSDCSKSPRKVGAPNASGGRSDSVLDCMEGRDRKPSCGAVSGARVGAGPAGGQVKLGDFDAPVSCLAEVTRAPGRRSASASSS